MTELNAPNDGFPLTDPIEDTPEFKRVIEQAKVEVVEKMVSEGVGEYMARGFGPVTWPYLKEHLKAKYGIDWRTPAEMNPEILFD